MFVRMGEVKTLEGVLADGSGVYRGRSRKHAFRPGWPVKISVRMDDLTAKQIVTGVKSL
jgi:hypothetical protein